MKCDGTRAETRFRLSAKRTSPLKSAGGASVQSTTGSRGVRISGSNAGYTMFRGSVKGTGYPLQSPVSPSLPLPCVTVCHHVSTGLYDRRRGTGSLGCYRKHTVHGTPVLDLITVKIIALLSQPAECIDDGGECVDSETEGSSHVVS